VYLTGLHGQIDRIQRPDTGKAFAETSYL